MWHDLLGVTPEPLPRFVKQYANLGAAALAALRAYVSDVREGRFPEPRHTYSMSEGELEALERELAAATNGDE